MAIYVASRTRRRRAIAGAAVALLVGLGLGFAGGRATAPTTQDRIRSIQGDAREISSGLRVIALHDEAGIASGDDGAALVLERTEADLRDALHDAAWIRADERRALLRSLHRLQAVDDRSSKAFGERAEAFADEIDEAFGNAPAS